MRNFQVVTRTAAILILVLSVLASTSAHAQAITTVVVPWPPGGTPDSVARILTQKIAEKTKQSYIVDNRPGANGIIGAKAAAGAKADGTTWLVTDGTPLTVNPFLYPPDPNFSPARDLRVVRSLVSQPSVLVVSTRFSGKTLKEFVEQARQREMNYASAGVGSASHLAMAYFGNLSGAKLNHVPYRGGPQVLNALLAGEIDAAFVILPNALPHLQSGKVVALAQSGAQRSPRLLAVPTMQEVGYPNFVVEWRYFAWLPSATPDAMAKTIDGLLLAALSDPSVADRLRSMGLEPTTNMGEAESRQWLVNDRETWQRVIRENNIKAD